MFALCRLWDHDDCGKPYLAVMDALKAVVDSPSPAVLMFN